MNKLIYLLPAVTLCVLAYLQIVTLIDKHTITLTATPIPYFDIAAMAAPDGSEKRLTTDSLKNYIQGEPIMVNFFATWCSTCLIEHKQIVSLAEEHGLKIIGIAYRDDPKDITPYMIRLGNPYAQIALDPDGYAAAGWKVSGTPESFFLDTNGVVRYHFRGPIRERDMKRILQIIHAVKNDTQQESG